MIKRFVAFVVCVLIAFPCSVLGNTYVPQIGLTWNGGSNWLSSYESNDVTVTPNGDCNSYGLNDTLTNYDDVFNAYWSVAFSPDPYVIAFWGIMNISNETQTFTYTVTTPVDPPITIATMYSGDMSGSFSTDPAGGTLSTVSPDPLYYGLIDGVGVLPLHPDLSSWTRTEFGTTPIPYTSAGPLPNGPVWTDIGIQFKFSLTPGDAAAFTATFEVTPEPATICLLGLGALSLLRRRRA